MKKYSILLAGGLLSLSLFSLTSCGENKTIDFKSYKNEVSKDDFQDAYLDAIEIDTENKSYIYEDYYYYFSDANVDGEKMSTLSYRDTLYEVSSNKLFKIKKSEVEKENTTSSKRDSKTDEEKQIQINGNENLVFDLKNKTYTDVNYSYKLPNIIFGGYESTYISMFKDVKYYHDDNVFTMTFDNIVSDTGNVKINEAKMQFSIDNNTYYYTFVIDYEGSNTTKSNNKEIKADMKLIFKSYKKLEFKDIKLNELSKEDNTYLVNLNY